MCCWRSIILGVVTLAVSCCKLWSTANATRAESRQLPLSPRHQALRPKQKKV